MVFIMGPLLTVWTMDIQSSIGCNACCSSRRCFAKFDFCPLFVITGVFFVSDMEWPACLSGVLLLALRAGELVYTVFIVFAVLVVIVFPQQRVDVISGGKRNPDVKRLEQLCDVSHFRAHIGELCPLCFSCFWPACLRFVVAHMGDCAVIVVVAQNV